MRGKQKKGRKEQEKIQWKRVIFNKKKQRNGRNEKRKEGVQFEIKTLGETNKKSGKKIRRKTVEKRQATFNKKKN